MKRPSIALRSMPLVARDTCSASPSYRVIRPSGSADWLLIHSHGGCGRIIGPRGEVDLLPGSAVLFAPGCPHDYGTRPGDAAWKFHWAHFIPRDGWEELLAWPSTIGGPGIVAVSGETRGLIEQAWVTTSQAAKQGWPEDIETGRSGLEFVLRLYARMNAGRSRDIRVRDAMDAIANEPCLALELARLARTAGLSPSRFAHLFREHAGMSPGRWGELVRLRRAAAELLADVESISDVADRAGFTTDPFYLLQQLPAPLLAFEPARPTPQPPRGLSCALAIAGANAIERRRRRPVRGDRRGFGAENAVQMRAFHQGWASWWKSGMAWSAGFRGKIQCFSCSPALHEAHGEAAHGAPVTSAVEVRAASPSARRREAVLRPPRRRSGRDRRSRR